MIAAVRAPFAKTGKSLILGVEDDKAQLRLLKAILEKEGFAILQAATAANGLRLFREKPVSLIVIDQRLGKKQMTGAQLARKVKALKPTVPIVLRSGYPPESMGNWDAFINKGEPVEIFLEIVRDLIKRSCE